MRVAPFFWTSCVRQVLPKRLSWRISEAIGVSHDWLLDNDLSQPPINQAGRPYSRDDLIVAQDKRPQDDFMSVLIKKGYLTEKVVTLSAA